jgi:hypothetical protein
LHIEQTEKRQHGFENQLLYENIIEDRRMQARRTYTWIARDLYLKKFRLEEQEDFCTKRYLSKELKIPLSNVPKQALNAPIIIRSTVAGPRTVETIRKS